MLKKGVEECNASIVGVEVVLLVIDLSIVWERGVCFARTNHNEDTHDYEMLRVAARGSGSAVYGKPGPKVNYQRVGVSTGKICKRCPLLGYNRRDSRLVSCAADR